ncbi:MAG TPA: amidohydrolase family protein [Chloroflexota bacterium]|nr:amidohydrolase family protein [Chloroflexota bacterium]
MHAHFVPPAAVEKACAEPAKYGLKVEAGRPAFEGGTAAPPLLNLVMDWAPRPNAKVDVQLIGNWMDTTGYTLPPDKGAAWSRLFNQELAAAAAQRPERFRTLASLPMQDGARAAEELELAVKELGMKGAMIGTNIAGRNLDEPAFEPVWRKAVELGVPIVLHPYNTVPTERLGSYYFSNLLGNPFDTLIAAASLIFGGVCDRFPELKIVLLHGGGHLPYQAGRLNHGWKCRPESTLPQQPPLEYLRWFRYDTIVHWPNALRYLLDTVGSDRVMLGSDDPFDMGDMEPQVIVAECGCAGHDAERVIGDNAAELFRL